MSDTILAIDKGKFNSVLCWYEPGTRDATIPRAIGMQLTNRKNSRPVRPSASIQWGRPPVYGM